MVVAALLVMRPRSRRRRGWVERGTRAVVERRWRGRVEEDKDSKKRERGGLWVFADARVADSSARVVVDGDGRIVVNGVRVKRE